MAAAQKADIASFVFDAGSTYEAKVGVGKGFLAPQGPRVMGNAARHGKENFCSQLFAGEQACPSQVSSKSASFDFSDHLPFVLRDVPAFPVSAIQMSAMQITSMAFSKPTETACESRVGVDTGGPRLKGNTARYGKEILCSQLLECPSQASLKSIAFDLSDHSPSADRDFPAHPVSRLTSASVPPVAPPSPQILQPPPGLEQPAVPAPWGSLLTGLRAEPMKVTMSDSYAGVPGTQPDQQPAPERPSQPLARQGTAAGEREGRTPSRPAAEQQPQQPQPQQPQQPASRSEVKQSTLVLAYFPRQASDAEICHVLDKATGHQGCVRDCRVVREGGLYGIFEFVNRDLAAAVLNACEDGKIVMRDQSNNKKWFMHASRSKRVTVESFNASHSSQGPRKERGWGSRGD